MNEELLSLLGATPEQIAQARRQSGFEELSLLGQSLMQAGAPAPRGTTTLGRLGQAASMYQQAPRQSMDTLLQDLLRKQQAQDMQRKQQEQVQRQQQMQQFISGLPPEQQSLAQMAPQDFVTQQIQAQFREPKQAPGVVGEFNAALQAGLIQPGTTLEQYVAMKKPPGTTVNVGGQVSPFEKKVQEGKAGMFLEIEKSGIAAQRSAQDVNRLDKLLSNIETGGAAAFKQFAGNFGINTEGLDEIQAAQAIINKLVPAQRPPGSGPMSDADLELFKQSMPRIINQPGGNKLIIEGMKQINRYLIEEGKIAAEVTAGKISPEEGTAKMFALGNPVQEFFDRTQSQAGISAGKPLPQGDLDLINRYLNRGR